MNDVLVFPLRRIADDYNWVTTVLALQGLVNRRGPRLQLDPTGLCNHGGADAHWREIYAERYGLAFTRCASLKTLLARFASDLAGLVLYDEALDATRSVALTLAGLESLLPVTPRQKRSLPAGLPVVCDLRGRWRSGHEACDWAVRELLPRCDPTVAYSLGHSHDDVDLGHDRTIVTALDCAVARRGFVFNLSPCEYRDQYPGHEIPGYKDDAVLLREILSRLDAPAAVYGWAEPEWTLTALLSDYNHYLMCGVAPNLSLHAALETGPATLKQKGGGAGPTELGQHVYLAFMTSEGDAPRIPTSFMFAHWRDPLRGSLPVNWGVNPVLLEQAPALMRYFYETATPNDYFFGGVGGAGYVFLDRVRDVDAFARHARRHLRRGDIHVTDHWAKGGGDLPRSVLERYGRFAQRCDQLGMTHIARRGWELEALPGGIPILFEHEPLVYFDGPAREVAAKVQRIVGDDPGPRFILLYGNPRPLGYYRDILTALGDPQRFVPVHLDTMMRLARQALERR